MAYQAAERRYDFIEGSEKQLERKVEEGRAGPNRNLNKGDCCIPAVNFRALEQDLCRKKNLLKAFVWRWGIDRLEPEPIFWS